LVSEKADKEKQNKEGKTALQLAQESLKKIVDVSNGQPPAKGSEEDKLRVIVDFLSEK